MEDSAEEQKNQIRKDKKKLLACIPLSQVSDKPRLSLRPQLTQFAARGSLEQLESLLEEGIDADTPSPNGTSALVIAAKYGQLKAVSILLKYGAKTHRQAIQAAQDAGYIEIVEHLTNATTNQSTA